MSNEPRSVTWSIQKASAVFTITPSLKYSIAVGETQTYTVTVSSGAAITVQSSDPSVVSVSISGSTMTVTGLSAGSCIIRIQAGISQNYYDPSISSVMTVQEALELPTQSGTLTYNTSSQSPLWNNYDPSKLTIGGVTSATDAGTYAATFTPNAGQKWVGGGNETRAAYWTMDKATPSVTAPTAKSLTYTGSTQALVNAGSTDGGTLQYSVDSTAWSTSIPEETNAGAYTVYYRVVGDANYDDVLAQSVSVTIEKAAQVVGLSSASISVDVGQTATITATWLGDGTLTAQSSSTNATVSVSGSTITVTGVSTGNATITASVSAGTNYLAGSATSAVTVQEADTNYLRFSSALPFTLAMRNNTKSWNGTLYARAGNGAWSEWDASSALSSVNGTIDLRGKNNTHMSTGLSRFVLTGSDISCTGNIETLLDYETVSSGNHPQMDVDGFSYMFYDCSALIRAPELPSTMLSTRCYRAMFSHCINLTTPPALPATTLAERCYYYMFAGCTNLNRVMQLDAAVLSIDCYNSMFADCNNLKMSNVWQGEYTYSFRIPQSGTGTDATNALTDMFAGTGGAFTGTPTINTPYYTNTPPVN